MLKKTIISLLACVIILSSCARTPKEISLNDSQERVEQDILKIEQIKKANESWEDNIEIDLYTAIALAIKNNRELKIKQLETGVAYRPLDKVLFVMLPARAANSGFYGSERYTASASATVPNTAMAGSIGTSYSTSRERDVNTQDLSLIHI